VSPGAVRSARRWRAGVALVIALVGAAAWGVMALPRGTSPAPADAQAVAAVTQRCGVAMLRGVCSAMRNGEPPPAASRVFIAGVGEVNASSYAALRREGDAMCQTVAQQCSADWNGAVCRIARAMYPPLGS